MRILQLCKKFPYPLKDGEQIAINTLTREFSLQGCEITVLAINTPKHSFNPLELPVNIRQQVEYEAVFVDTRVKPVKALANLFTNKSYNIERFYSVKVEAKLTELLNNQVFDIIQCEGIYMAKYLPIIRKYSKAKVGLRAHNVEYRIWEQLANSLNGWKKRYISILASRMKKFEVSQLNLFDAIVPMSETDSTQFKQMGANKPMLVIPIGLELKDYVVKNSMDNYPSLFHIGSMDWLPNVDAINWFLEKCWKDVHAKFPSLKLFLAGRNFPTNNNWKNYEGVEIVGEVANAKEFINSKSIMVVPLQQGSGMRVKIIEAMASGKAIISTSIGAEGIGATNGKNILIADTPDVFIECIERLVNNKKEYDSLCLEARSSAEIHFNNAELTKQLIQFYKQLT